MAVLVSSDTEGEGKMFTPSPGHSTCYATVIGTSWFGVWSSVASLALHDRESRLSCRKPT
jgi:hypothetical protein